MAEDEASRKIEPVACGHLTKLRLPYEIFGEGEIKLLFLTGMSLSRRAWVNQVIHFSALPIYSILVLENRGNGESHNAAGSGNYTTTAMARDVRRALDEVKWTERRSVHVIGLSLGGMIALQLAKLIPERIGSLCLTSTCAHWMPPVPDIQSSGAALGFTFTTSEHLKCKNILNLCFPAGHLGAYNESFPKYKTNRERYQSQLANLVSRAQSKAHFAGQIAAVSCHHTSSSNLRRIGETIGFAYVVVGDQDRLVNPWCSEVLRKGIGCKKRVYAGHGHLIPWQSPAEYNKDLEGLIMQAGQHWREHPDES